MSDEPPPEPPNFINVDRRLRIDLPTPNEEDLITVRRADFDRISRDLERLNQPTPWFQTWASTFIGFGLGCLVAMVALSQAQDVQVWAMTFHWVVMVTALAVGVVFCFADWTMKRLYKSRLGEVQEDVRALHRRPSQPTAAASPQTPPTAP